MAGGQGSAVRGQLGRRRLPHDGGEAVVLVAEAGEATARSPSRPQPSARWAGTPVASASRSCHRPVAGSAAVGGGVAGGSWRRYGAQTCTDAAKTRRSSTHRSSRRARASTSARTAAASAAASDCGWTMTTRPPGRAAWRPSSRNSQAVSV